MVAHGGFRAVLRARAIANILAESAPRPMRMVPTQRGARICTVARCLDSLPSTSATKSLHYQPATP